MNESDIVALVKDDLFPKWRTERRRLEDIDRWLRWDHDQPHSPRTATKEYRELAARSQAPWGALVVTAAVQQLYVEGFRAPGASEDAVGWRAWQANGMDARQIPLHRAALGYGLAYMTVIPGSDPLTGERMAVMRGVSPRRMVAFYENPAEDEWPLVALRVDHVGQSSWQVRVYDDQKIHHLSVTSESEVPKYDRSEEHGVGVCPVVRYANQLDLEGRANGEVEPFIPLFARIDQTAFDRLVVQRFSSWVVRTIAGMTRPDDATAADAEKMRLKVEDILIADDHDTKFGSLPATPLDGFIKAHENDVNALAAVSQTPAHEMLGAMANLSADALAAAEASLTRKVQERRHTLGESHEQSLRLAAWIMGDAEAARDYTSEVRWADTESRSLAQAADALGKLAQMLGVPVQLLWTKIPGFTDNDVAEAQRLFDEQGGVAAILQQLASAQAPGDDLAVL